MNVPLLLKVLADRRDPVDAVPFGLSPVFGASDVKKRIHASKDDALMSTACSTAPLSTSVSVGIRQISRTEPGRRFVHMNTLRHDSIPSPLGPLLLVADDADQLRGLYLPDHKGGPAAAPGRHDAGGVIGRAGVQLDEYFAGSRRAFDLPLATAGSPLQEQVWAKLRAVPYGATTTYGRIATDLGMGPGAARAVGRANGANPLSIIVPCHRVVGASGSLTGYAGGVQAKRRLLGHEARVVAGAPGSPTTTPGR
jgi:methylated-DNA-[protein]-cysteine S-methyltransferase